MTILVVSYVGVEFWRKCERLTKESEIRTDLEPIKQELLELKTRVSALEEKYQLPKKKEEEQ